jgi:hypothetical protein
VVLAVFRLEHTPERILAESERCMGVRWGMEGGGLGGEEGKGQRRENKRDRKGDGW